MSDHYETLNVPRDATPEQIKKSFRELALKYHPDRNPDNPQAEEQFKRINEAYSVLSDPEKKARYDSGVPEGYAAYETAGAGTAQGYNPYGPYGPYAQDDGEEGQGGWTFYGPFGVWDLDTQTRSPASRPGKKRANGFIRSILTVVAGRAPLFRVSLIFGIFGLIICVMAISRGSHEHHPRDQAAPSGIQKARHNVFRVYSFGQASTARRVPPGRLAGVTSPTRRARPCVKCKNEKGRMTPLQERVRPAFLYTGAMSKNPDDRYRDLGVGLISRGR